MTSALTLYLAAALAEIAGCFAFWAWLRLGRTMLWVAPGMLSLALFAFLLTRVQADFAGRAYAAYGGIYIVASLLWLWQVEGQRPDRWDLGGAALCLAGAAVVLLGRNSTTAAALLHMLHLRCRQMLLLQLVLPDRLVVMPPLMLLLQR